MIFSNNTFFSVNKTNGKTVESQEKLTSIPIVATV